MLLFKLKELECDLEHSKLKNASKLKMVSSLKDTLLKIDFRAEEIPEYSFDKIIQVLEDVNGEKLSFDEKKIIQKLILK